jgi:hypothetical protein
MFFEEAIGAAPDAGPLNPESVSRSVTAVLAISAAALLLFGLLPALLTAPAVKAVLGG